MKIRVLVAKPALTDMTAAPEALPPAPYVTQALKLFIPGSD